MITKFWKNKQALSLWMIDENNKKIIFNSMCCKLRVQDHKLKKNHRDPKRSNKHFERSEI